MGDQSLKMLQPVAKKAFGKMMPLFIVAVVFSLMQAKGIQPQMRQPSPHQEEAAVALTAGKVNKMKEELLAEIMLALKATLEGKDENEHSEKDILTKFNASLQHALQTWEAEKIELVSKIEASMEHQKALETLLYGMTEVKAHEPTGSSASNSTNGNARDDPKESFAACLVLMDDNHFLIEWLAYHYHVLVRKSVAKIRLSDVMCPHSLVATRLLLSFSASPSFDCQR
jgi:hypothetical protein